MKTSLNKILPVWTVALVWAAVTSCQTGCLLAAQTYSVLDYYHPVHDGNEWVYQAQGLYNSSTRMLERIAASSVPVICYSNRTSPKAFTRDAVRVYSAYGDDDGSGNFIPSDEWYEYHIAQGSWGVVGSDDLPISDPSSESLRVFPGVVLPSAMAVGQSVSVNGEMYLRGVYKGTMTVKWQLVEQGATTVPLGSYADCLHFRYTVVQGGETQTNDEWWARGVGKVKKTRHVVKPGETRDELYQLLSASFVRGAWITLPPSSTMNAAGTTASFYVRALGEEPLTYQWRKDGVDLADQPGKLLGVMTTNLTVANVQSADLGGYSVVVSNVYGAVTSSVAMLSLAPPEKMKPTLTITTPARNARLTNAVVTATGTAKDNVQVAAVWCQLNTNAWQQAVGTTSWSAADLDLTPGLNLLRAYAVDTSGNHSVTGSVSFKYAVMAPLEVHVVGLGKVSPNYDGKWLEIGARYKMSAIATSGSGFKFHDWSGSLSTNKSMLSFTMASNLTFTATFVDVQRPVNALLFPKSKQVVNSSTVDLVGKARDNWGVQIAWYQMNGTGWYPATTTNHWTNWVATAVPVQGGKNLVQTYAEDAAGNRSLTNTVSFVSTVTVPNIAGFWNATTLVTPAQVTWDLVNGLQTGDGFSTSTGSMTIDTDGTLSGNTQEPFTGTYSFGTNGQLIANITLDGVNTNVYNMHLNASQDTLIFTGSGQGVGQNYQELLVFQRAPVSLAGADLAAAWNVAQFDTPAQLSWDPGTGLIGGSQFEAVTGTMRAKADGTLTADVGGAVSGRYTLGINGQVVVTLLGHSQPQTLFVNAGKDLMVLGHGENNSTNNYQELMLFVRVPATVTKADLAGFWNATWFATPGRMSWTPSSGSPLSDNFGSDYGMMVIKADGTVTGDVRGAYSGTISSISSGRVVVSGTSGRGNFKSTFFLNANEDMLVLVSSSLDPNDNIQQLIIFQRAPVFSAP
jgi:hypothetical protein